MFDWHEDDEVRGTTWGKLHETEDHIVPYPKRSKDDTLLTVDVHHKKRRHEQASTNLSITEESKTEFKNDFPGSNSDSNSNFNTNEDLSAPRFDMDPWPDLPSLNSAFDEEGGSFLNCDWANIADFDDLDRIFRNNGSIFEQEVIGNADELLSPPTDLISAITPPFSVPVDEQSGGERKPLGKDMMADNAASISGRIECHSHLNNVRCEVHHHISEKADREKKLSKSRKKLEKNRTKLSQNLSRWPSNMDSIQQSESMKMQAPPMSPQSFHSAAFSQQTEGGPVYMGFFHCESQHSLPAYRYPTHAFPMVPMLLPTHPERKENHPVPPSHTVCPESSKHTSEVQSKSLTMTPQEKIEKLRRLQQVQALLAIQQQQQQFGKWGTSTEMSASQSSSQMNRSCSAAVSSWKVDEATKTVTSSELNMLQEIDEPHKISILIDDSLGETVFYQLQDAIGKLDIGIRLCIRDSLFRLARSALERHNAVDRSSTNKSSRDEIADLVNVETSIQDRSTGLPTETGTNHIDRTLAHLLFHRLPEAGTAVKDEVCPLSSNPDSKWSYTCHSVLEDKPEDAEELEIKPTLK